MNNMKIFIFVILILTVSACRQNTAETKPNAKPPQTAAATPQPTSSAPKNGNYDGKGMVTKINLELVSIEIDHEEIKGVMPPMKMEFFVKEKAEIEKLKVGDKVEFVLEYKDGQENIISIKKAQ
jgi:Cu/Ag efflux protein CusF